MDIDDFVKLLLARLCKGCVERRPCVIYQKVKMLLSELLLEGLLESRDKSRKSSRLAGVELESYCFLAQFLDLCDDGVCCVFVRVVGDDKVVSFVCESDGAVFSEAA